MFSFYQPGQHKQFYTALSMAFLFCFYIARISDAHIQTHAVNINLPMPSLILDDHFFFDDALFHRIVHHYHPILLREYVWLLIARIPYALLYAFWGTESLIRTFCVCFPQHSFPRVRSYSLETLPLFIAALEVFANICIMYVLHHHPFHPHWLVTIAGLLTALKHTLMYACLTTGFLCFLALIAKKWNQTKKLE